MTVMFLKKDYEIKENMRKLHLQNVIPFAWALMNSNFDEAYPDVFNELNNDVPNFLMESAIIPYER